jgi:hypothetical protein
MTNPPFAPQPLEQGPEDLEPFFASVRSLNPFVDNRVNGLSANSVDVDDIHRAEFERLKALAYEARDLRRGAGAVLWGEAGIGKSHLLSRLVRWAECDRQGVAVYLHNLQASPENLPRALLKSVVSILARGQVRGFGRTPLAELTFGFLQEALNHDASAKHPWPVVEQGYQRLIDRLGDEDPSRAALVDRTVYDVLYQFFRSAYRAPKTRDERVAALAVRWLSGDYLDSAEGRLLGLPPGRTPDEPQALADSQQIKKVLVALSRMALSRNQPFLICFDQVDNLDDEQAAALSRFLEALIDSAPNLLVVTVGVQASLLRWREMKVIQDSAWDRLAQFEVHLLRLTPEESRRIVTARLEKVVQPFVRLESVRQRSRQDPLFPLGRIWADEFFRDKIHLRPREVLNGAREGWRRQQEDLRRLGGPAWLQDWERPLPVTGDGKVEPAEPTEAEIREAVDSKVAQMVHQHCAQQRQQPDALAQSADHLADLIAGLLKQCPGVELDHPPSGAPDKEFPYHLVARRHIAAESTEARTGILFLPTGHATSTTAALRWLVDATDPRRILLITEQRRPLVFGTQRNAKGRKYYQELLRRDTARFRHIVLTFEELIHLDALRAVVGMARSGDLEMDHPGKSPRPLSEQEVIESYHRQGRFLLLPVLRDVLVEPEKKEVATSPEQPVGSLR